MRSDLRQTALKSFKKGVKAANPGACLKRAVKTNPIPIPNGGKYIVISVGKAAISLMRATINILPKEIPMTTLTVTNYENFVNINEFEIIAAGHPIPDKNGLRAGKNIIKILQSATDNDTVVMLISGGSSALLPAPLPGITLKDKIQLNEILLSADLNIEEVNLVRQSMSIIKGGGLLSILKSTPMISYILSDVIGDDIKVIGSGPTASPIGDREQARALLIKKNLYPLLSKKLKAFFDKAISKHSKNTARTNSYFKNVLIGNNQKSLHAMARKANAEIICQPITENVSIAAQIILEEIIQRKNNSIIRVAFGGETTVDVKGKGLGGRNQELALRFAYKMYQMNLEGEWCFLSGGTDGKDGITDATGAIVNQNTISKLVKKKISIEHCLHQNDSNTALNLTNDIFSIGPTGTNVADLKLFLGKIY